MALRMTTQLWSVLFFVGLPALAQAPGDAESSTPEPGGAGETEVETPEIQGAAEVEAAPSEPEGVASEATDEGRPSENEESPDEPAETSVLPETSVPTESLKAPPARETSKPSETPSREESAAKTEALVDARAGEERAASDDGAEDSVKLQKPFVRQGEFAALGAHFGMATADDTDYGMRKLSLGPAFTLRLGEAIVDWADIGLEFGFGLQGGEEKLTSGRIIAHTRLYPIERVFIHTGFGFGFAGGPDPEGSEFNRFRYGDVYVLGVGTNLYMRDRNKSGGPMFSPSLTFELGPDRELTTGVVWLGAEFSWWAGLRRHQLDLPIDDAYSRSPGD